MRRISSRTTFLSKRVFPIFWFSFLAIGFVVGLSTAGRSDGPPLAVLIVPVVMAIFGYIVMKKMLFDLVDEVWDAGDELVVKDKGAEEHIPLSDIMNISYSMFTNPQRVTLMLRRTSQFGQEISFVPPARIYPFWRSPIVDELIQRVDATRRR